MPTAHGSSSQTSGRLFPHIKCEDPETGVIVAGWEDDGATLYAVVPYEGNERVSTPNYYLCRHKLDIKQLLDNPAPAAFLSVRAAVLEQLSQQRYHKWMPRCFAGTWD